jgi:hypothetical protein
MGDEPLYLRESNPLGPTVILVLKWDSLPRKRRENKLNMSYLDVGKESEPYDLFVFAINAEQTRQKYITRMKKFLGIIGIEQENKLTLQERCKLFAKKARSENGRLANGLIQFLQYQKDRVNRKEITGSTLRNYVKVIKLFCEMNDLIVPWKKLEGTS